MATLPPPPINDKPGSFTWLEWYRQLRNYVSTSGSVPWYIINFAGSNITDIALREHNNMQGVQGGASGEKYHLTNAQVEDLVTGSYGSMYIDNGSVARTIAVANTYYEIASGFTGGLSSQFTFQNSKELKCNRAGTYRVDWQMSRSVPGVAQEIEGGVFKNGTIQPSTTAHNQSQTAGTTQSFSGSGILTLAVNDLVSLAVNNNTSTNTITITHANLSIHRVGT
jgi:hypothetical protein